MASSAMEATKNEIWHKGNLGDEDDARTLNTRIAQRKHVIPHSVMKNNRNIIECCNNTHQEVPCTGKQMCACASDLGDASRSTCM